MDAELLLLEALPVSEERVIELSSILNSFPWPEHVKRNNRFQNLDGVDFPTHQHGECQNG
jgi:hypothetical protein